MEISKDEISADREKCTKQHVLNVDRNAKFLSNQKKDDLFFAKNAILRKDLKENFSFN